MTSNKADNDNADISDSKSSNITVSKKTIDMIQNHIQPSGRIACSLCSPNITKQRWEKRKGCVKAKVKIT